MTRFLLVMINIGLFCSVAFAGSEIHSGLWEMTTETEMVGMPGMKMPPQTHRQCLTQEDMVPQSEEASKECRLMDMHQNGNTVVWKIVCSGENGEMEGSGKTTYQGDTLDGEMNLVIKGANMQIKNTIKGRRIGDCPAQ